MKRLLLLALLTVMGIHAAFSQDIPYTSLYDASTFSAKTIVTTLPVGSTGGGGNVSPNGGAVYSIPIGIPPGTNGAEPSISLEYGSQYGPGIAGMGWDISGLSMISRIGRNNYFDGVTGPVELSANDRFALDGTRLVLKNGTYGAASSTYGTETENFATITAVGTQGGGPLSFDVLTKDGVKMEFGKTADSRLMSETGNTVMFWRLNKVTNPDGNYIEYVYTSTITERDSRISEIRYTGNVAANLTPYNKITFSYKIRQETAPGTFSDIRTIYQGGSSILSKYLLDKIVVTTENQTVKSLQLAYGHDNVNSYLKSITESGSDNVSLNPTIFKYGDAPVETTNGTASVPSGNDIQSFSADFDGDGSPDLLTATTSHNSTYDFDYITQFKTWERETTTGGYSPLVTQTLPLTSTFILQNKPIPSMKGPQPIDVNGDGLDDVIVLGIQFVPSGGGFNRLNEIIHYQSSNGGATLTPVSQTAPIIGGSSYSKIPSVGKFFIKGDFDGDGIVEYVLMLGKESDDNYGIFYYDNVPGQPNTFSEVIQFPTSSLNTRTDWYNAARFEVIDFNGDGKSDILFTWDTGSEVFTFQSPTVAQSLYQSATFPAYNSRNYFGDFNGDGKTDIIQADFPFENVKKGISTGTTFTQSTLTLTKPWSQAVPPSAQNDVVVVGDYNGDGKSDFYYSWGRTINFPNSTGYERHYISGSDVYYSRGDAFRYKQISYLDQIEPTFARTMATTFVDIPLDLNGDGRTDLVSSNGSNLSFRLFNKNGKDDLLHKVSNGFNHITEWTYKSLIGNGTFYTKGSGTSSYPLNIIQPTAILVSDLSMGDGLGNNSFIQYSYEGARYHRAGKGFLGFGKVTSLKIPTSVQTVSENEFNSTFYSAAPKKTSVSIGSTLISETTLTNTFFQAAPKRFWIKTTNVSENHALEGATITTANVFDDTNGNVTSSTVTSPTGTVVTGIVYAAYPAGILNKPKTITVTSTRTGQSAFTAVTELGYNAKGQVTSKIDFFGKPKAVTTTYGYNALGNQTSVQTSATGITTRTVSTVFDGKGRYPETKTDELSQVSTIAYDAKWGTPTSVTTIDGLVTTNTYDGFGRKKTTTVNNEYTITNTPAWDISGNRRWKLTTSHSVAGRATTIEWFDHLNRSIRKQTKAFDDTDIEANTVYDLAGNVYSTEQPHKSTESFITTTNSYDALNRLSSVNAGALGTTTYGYAYSGGNTTVTTTTPTGVSSKTTDVVGKQISSTDDGGTLTYTYFSHGGLAQVKNGATVLTSNLYDEYGKQTKLTDANAGVTEYLYNAIGELTWQKHANGAEYTLAYDLGGRVTTRTGIKSGTTLNEVTTTEYYTDNSSGKSKGKLKKVTGFATNNNTVYEYDSRGQLFKQKATVDNVLHETSYTYNVYGDLLTTTYPSGLQVTQNYKSNGYLETITGAGTTLYTTTGVNGQGQVTNYKKGTVKSSSITYVNGFPTAYLTDGVQDYRLAWNYQKGNVTSRNDARSLFNKTESFVYDALNRLTSATIGGTNFTATYKPNGNIDTKADVGTYTYDPSKFNAATGVVNPTSVIPSNQQTITYTAFNQPDTIRENNYVLAYTYGADYNRIKGELKLGTTSQYNRYYFDGFEKDVVGSTTRYIQYIAGPTGLVAIVESVGGTHTVHYTYTDHLGSILTVANNAGTIEAEQSFDAWGRRRNPTSWALLAPTAATTLPVWLIRGYTGHEHLDQFGLINMNGRMYDPVLGRMLSPDNYVQEPEMTQSYNRYSYAMNNPMVYTDPDGNFWNFVIGAALGGFTGWQIGKANGARGWGMVGYIAGGAAIGAFTAGVGDAVTASFGLASSGINAASIGAYAASGAISGGIAGASFSALAHGGARDILKGALVGGLVGGTIGALGGALKNIAANASVYNSDNYLAFCDECASVYKGQGGILLAHATASLTRQVADYVNFGNNLAMVFLMNAKYITGSDYLWIPPAQADEFVDDMIADAMRNAHGVGNAREDFYKKYRGGVLPADASLTNYRAGFGIPGLFRAGMDPIEQFVGNYRIDIHVIDRTTLRFTLTNNTSFTSLAYGLGPSWEIGPLANYTQRYIFTEQINFGRLR